MGANLTPRRRPSVSKSSSAVGHKHDNAVGGDPLHDVLLTARVLFRKRIQMSCSLYP